MKPDAFPPREAPWTAHHWLGVTVVLLLFVALALGMWPGWSRIGEWWG
jgi:hypothetical protein